MYNNEEVLDEYNNKVELSDDDYEYYKYLQENHTNPLSDDYCKYDE